MMGFPCNQFKHQEQGSNATEIMNNIKYVRPGNGFVPNFQLSEKLDVNGENEILLYKDMKVYKIYIKFTSERFQKCFD